MKTLRLISLVVVMTGFLSLSSVQAQYNARRLTRRIAPQTGPASTNATAAAPTAAAPAPATPTPPLRPVPVRVVQPVDPEKAKAAKEESLRKTVEFQKKRADEGSESAQYELGMRYIKGDGVEKDEGAGRKWLALSAKNGYSPATKKLAELEKSSPPGEPSHTAPPVKEAKDAREVKEVKVEK